MIASFGSLMIGSSTSSMATFRKPCQVTAFISASHLAPVGGGQMRAGLWAHLHHAAVDYPGGTGHISRLGTAVRFHFLGSGFGPGGVGVPRHADVHAVLSKGDRSRLADAGV